MWLKEALQSKPKQSVIGVLKAHLGGSSAGRSMDTLHASDVTKNDFCPRKWALFDMLGKKAANDYLTTALDVTFRMGSTTERLLVEEWAGDAVVGNWECRFCGDKRSMVPHPTGCCATGRKHWWRYVQVVVEDSELKIEGGLDALFNVGAPQLLVTEIKTLTPPEFESMLVPQPEHRLRTNLYLRLVEHSLHAYKDLINTQEGRVLYVSRGHGKMHPEWKEILPFKEFIVKRNDADLAVPMQRAGHLKAFRTGGVMPPGICTTALDKIAKQCSVCQHCFSGKFPANQVLQIS